MTNGRVYHEYNYNAIGDRQADRGDQFYTMVKSDFTLPEDSRRQSRESISKKKKRHSVVSQANHIRRDSSQSAGGVVGDHFLQLFPERTTFHGIRDCFHTWNEKCPRVTWVMIIILASVAALHGCFMIVNEFIARPVVVSYFIQEAASLPLPDIVICPFNRFNRSYLDTLNISEGLAQYLELSFPSPVLHSIQMRKYRSTIRHLDKYDAELTELLRDIGNISFTEFIKQDCSAFFDNKDICNNLTEIMTSAGKCFRIPGIDQEGDGFGYGMRVVIKLPQELYNPGVNQMLNNGVAVKLAERNRGIDHDLSFIPAGVHAIMPLSATRYEFIDDPPRYNYNRIENVVPLRVHFVSPT
ncbi:amiloride-sensitive sodium channel domain-containing protein [Ditylenchus destructor]|nr:amiloride-sensitive sodium channel domain-containing protein [Ditylenchus destructor]